MSPDAWPMPTYCPRQKDGSSGTPAGALRRAQPSSRPTEDDMRALTRRLPGLAALAALTVTAAARGSTQANTGSSTTDGSTVGAAKTAGFPVSLAAANGTVKVASRPTAIVSLSPTATEMLYAIGAGSQVKAVDSLSDYPRQAPRTKLSAYQPNVEAIAAEKPDLVVESGDTGQIGRTSYRG